MRELYTILDEFLNVEYKQRALLNMIKSVEKQYEESDNEEIRLLISLIKWQIESQQKELLTAISKLDVYALTAK